MLSKNSYCSFDERPNDKSDPVFLCMPFLVEIMERLLHRLAKPLSEFSRIEGNELLVKGMNSWQVMYPMQTSSDTVSAALRS